MRSKIFAAILAPAAIALATGGGAQPVRSLTKPDAEFAEPFTQVTAVRELRDGRVIVADSRDKVVQLVDFRAGNAAKVGREGNGPREYALPMALVALPGDTSAVYDPLNRRLLVILPDGTPGDFMTINPAPSQNAGGGMVMSLTPPRYTDARGRFYFAGPAMRMGEGGPVEADSVPLLRYDRSTKARDTVGWIRTPRNNMQASGGAGRQEIRMGMANPFAPRDEWAVTPDGRVAVIRSPEYRVDWQSPSRQGTPIAYQKVKVTEKHKEAWRESRRAATMMTMTVGPSGQTTTSSGSAARANLPEPSDWPDVMPPFLSQAAFAAPDGSVWIARTREANDDLPVFDVIDASGKVVQRVRLPARTRLVGFGAGVVYTARTDEDDLQYLQRFRM